MKLLNCVLVILVGASFVQASDNTEASCNDNKKIYKVCTDQYRAFENALKKAKASDKLVLVTFGAEWCPWCLSMNQVLNDNKVWKKLEAKVLRSDIGIYKYDSRKQVETGRKVLDELLAINKKDPTDYKGIPLLAVVDPKTKKTIFINSGDLEKNTKKKKGHDKAKVTEVILHATLNI